MCGYVNRPFQARTWNCKSCNMYLAQKVPFRAARAHVVFRGVAVVTF